MSSNSNKFGGNNNNNKFGGNNNKPSSSNSNKFGGNNSSNNNNNSNKFGNSNKPKTNNQVTSFSSKSTSTPSSSNRNTQRAAVGGAGAAAASGNVVEGLVARIIGLQVPVVQPEILQLAMAILNLFFFGVGVIVCGALNNDLIDVVIGILQLVIPFVGWAWSVLWGILMILVLLNNKK